MFRFLFLLNLILTPFLANAYDRAQCDNVIDVKKYIVAGSLDNQSAGGKTYSFKKIVGAIENELLSGQPPRPDYFACMNMLHKKANEDATEYWFGRLARSTCALDSGVIPDVKPPGCDDDLWEKFHASKADIDRSAARVTELTTKCVSRGNVKSCESIQSLKAIEEVAENVGAKASDECCDTNNGKAFKVLRGFYTIEFSNTSDADLQKECYKRTRAENKVNSFSKAGQNAAKCAKGLILGLFEAVKKWFSLAKSLKELGSGTEIWNAITSPGFGDKIWSLVEAMGDQMSAQLGATVGCFTGEYRGEQICKLASSFLLDFVAGGVVGKGIKFLLQLAKAGVKDIAILAKNLVASGASKVAAKVATKSGASSAVGRAATSLSNASARAAARKTANSLAQAIKPVADFSKSVASRIKKFREKENIKMNPADRRDPTWGPNASTAVGPAETAGTGATNMAAQSGNQAVIQAATRTGSSAGKKIVENTNKAAGKIEKDIRAFRDTNYKAMYANRVTRAVDAPETLFVKPSRLKGKTPTQQIQIIEEAAASKRLQINRMANSGRRVNGKVGPLLTEVEARQLLNNVDDALSNIRRRLGVSEGNLVSGGSSSVSAVAAGARTVGAGAAPADLTAVATNAVDTAIPSAPASIGGSTGATAVIGTSTTSATTSFTNTAVSFIDNLPKVDIKTITSSTTKMSKTLQQQIDSLQTFEARARTNAAAANPSATARSSVWANQSSRAISKDALRRHGEIENLYKKGLINDEQAHAMHDIVRVTENSATGTATRFNTQYISIPNTNPSTFVLKERSPPLTAAGAVGLVLQRSTYSDIGSVTTNKQIEQTSDAANGQRYDLDTIKASSIVVLKLTETPSSISKEFSKLKTETEILDRADELRVKVKTIENSAGADFDAEAKEALGELIKQINIERDRALARIKPKGAAVPASVDPAIKFGIPIDPDAE
jgi:hypothetical protein